MNIQQYLTEHPDLRPLDILIPENCALCLDHNNATVHVMFDDSGDVIIMDVSESLQ